MLQSLDTIGKKRWASLFVFLLVLALDQVSKFWAVETLKGQPAQEYLSLFTLTYAQNSGAWGSLGANWSPGLRSAFLIAMPAVILLLLAVYVFRQPKLELIEGVGCAFLLAGGIGNLIDRVRFQYVIDFLYIGYGRIGTNIFNIADMAVLVGVGSLLWISWQQGQAEKAEAEAQGSSTSTS